MTDEPISGEPTSNRDMEALQRQLVDLAARLDAAIDDAPSAAAVHALNVQIAAVNTRITTLGRRLFAVQTAELSAAAHDVGDEIQKVEHALSDLDRLDGVVSGITGVLSLADKAIALAKTAAV